jgi:hypothetical protein
VSTLTSRVTPSSCDDDVPRIIARTTAITGRPSSVVHSRRDALRRVHVAAAVVDEALHVRPDARRAFLSGSGSLELVHRRGAAVAVGAEWTTCYDGHGRRARYASTTREGRAQCATFLVGMKREGTACLQSHGTSRGDAILRVRGSVGRAHSDSALRPRRRDPSGQNKNR